MSNKLYTALAAVLGAVSAPLLVHKLLLDSSMGGTPFIEYEIPAGRSLVLSGTTFWVFVAALGGLSFGAVTALVSRIATATKH